MNPQSQAKQRGMRRRLKAMAFVLGCSLLALVAANFLFVRQDFVVRDAVLQQSQFNRWQAQLQNVLTLLTDAETAQRGYLLTGKVRYLDPYGHARQQLPKTLETIRGIGTSDPEVVRRVEDIDRQADMKLVELEKSLRLYDGGDRQGALALVQTDLGEQYMERIREDVAAVATAIRISREHSTARVVAGSFRTQKLALITVTVLVVTVLLAALQTMTFMSSQAEYERALHDLTDVFDSTTDFVAQTDELGRIRYVNPSARRGLGLPLQGGTDARRFAEFHTSKTEQRWSAEIIPTARREGVWVGETDLILASEREIPVSHMVIAHYDAQGEIVRYSSVMRDISGEVADRQELARQTATLNAIVEAAPSMIAVLDSRSRYLLVNSTFERWMKRGREEVIGRSMEEVAGPPEYARNLPRIKQALAGETVTFENEYPRSRHLRHISITYIPMRVGDGSVAGFIAIAQNITSQWEEKLRLLSLSERDPLTGLLNRAGFHNYLERKSAQGEGRFMAVLYIDLDHFKPVNDSHGHAAGDEVLREFALRLLTLVRPTDAVARLGGDEFGIALCGVREPGHAATVGNKVVEMAHEPIVVADIELTIGASVGVAVNADWYGGWNGLIERADAMVYEAKAAGRGRCVAGRPQAFA